jgi:hypothetical protein
MGYVTKLKGETNVRNFHRLFFSVLHLFHKLHGNLVL